MAGKDREKAVSSGGDKSVRGLVEYSGDCCPLEAAIRGKLERYGDRRGGVKKSGDQHCLIGEWLEIHEEER